MRVLITSTPGFGHVHPLVPLAEALALAGHEVTWATAAASCERLSRLGFRTTAAGIDSEQRRQRLRAGWPHVFQLPGRERRLVLFPALFASIAAPVMLAELRPVMDSVRPDLVVHETAEFAAAPLAAARGIPHVTVGFGALLSPALLTATQEALADLWATEGLEPSPAGGLYDHLYLHPFPGSLGAMPKDVRIQRMRPLGFDGAQADESPTWLSSLGRDRPLVYATFGTELGALAPWAAVIEALSGLDVDALLTVGGGLDPAALGTAPPNIRIERYVPQRSVLAVASALVSHAGSGAVLGAALQRRPQVCMPLSADQFDNADAVAAAGIGLVLEPEQAVADAIARGTTRVPGEPSFRDAAERVAVELLAMPTPAAHVSALEALVAPRGIRGQQSRS